VQSVDDAFNALLSDARHDAAHAGWSAADIDAALFAAVAWADEVLNGAGWEGAAHWQRRLLQKRYFNVSNGGVAFFTRLESLNGAQQAVREVYVMCLGLGFAGRYGHDGNQKALAGIRHAAMESVLADGEGAGQHLFPDAYGAHLPVIGKQPARRWGCRFLPWPRWLSWSPFSCALLLTPLLILVTLYATFHVIIAQSVHTLLRQIIL
jgi:type VI secretion system protein ImpK